MLSSALLLAALLLLETKAQTYSATYLPSTAPKTTEQGQYGTNQCGTGVNQTSVCQNAYINSVDDWCVWAPPEPGPDSVIGNTERYEVAWCLKAGYGTRLIPDGSITGAHFIKTPDFVQVTGVGDLTFLNIPRGDGGGELDPHGADGNGNPIGGLVFSTAFGQLQQLHEWTNFVSDSEFCFRACKEGPNAPTYCQHIYDVMGCEWNMPANYDAGVFESCAADSGEPMGIYGGSTFYQGSGATPPAHPAPSSSSCTTVSSIGNGFTISGAQILTPTSTSTSTSASTSTSTSTSTSASTSTPTSATTSVIGSTPGASAPTSTATNSSSTSGAPSNTAANTGFSIKIGNLQTIALMAFFYTGAILTL